MPNINVLRISSCPLINSNLNNDQLTAYCQHIESDRKKPYQLDQKIKDLIKYLNIFRCSKRRKEEQQFRRQLRRKRKSKPLTNRLTIVIVTNVRSIFSYINT